MASKKETRSSHNNAKDRPAKAGKRKIYVNGTRKTKDWQSKGYSMPQRSDIVMELEHKTALRRRRQTVDKIDQMERRTRIEGGHGSDPFIFARMRAHAMSGILEL